MSAGYSELKDGFIVGLSLLSGTERDKDVLGTAVVSLSDLEREIFWSESIFKDVVDLGYADFSGSPFSPNRFSIFRITDSGRNEAERLLSKTNYERVPQAVLSAWERRTSRQIAANSIDSSSWTGLPKTGILSEAAVGRLQVALSLADQALMRANASNEARAMARAYIVAIQSLSEAPEPPADLIWKVIERAASIASIASFFVSIIGLFQVVAH